MKSTQMHTTAHLQTHTEDMKPKWEEGGEMERWIDKKGGREIDTHLTEGGMDGLRDGWSDRLAWHSYRGMKEGTERQVMKEQCGCWLREIPAIHPPDTTGMRKEEERETCCRCCSQHSLATLLHTVHQSVVKPLTPSATVNTHTHTLIPMPTHRVSHITKPIVTDQDYTRHVRVTSAGVNTASSVVWWWERFKFLSSAGQKLQNVFPLICQLHLSEWVSWTLEQENFSWAKRKWKIEKELYKTWGNWRNIPCLCWALPDRMNRVARGQYQISLYLLLVIVDSRTLQQVKVKCAAYIQHRKPSNRINVHLSVMFTKMEASASRAVCTPEQTLVVCVCVWALLYCDRWQPRLLGVQ